jgi:uncharacterized membrane protein
MRTSKIADTLVTILFVIFLLWVAKLVLGVGFGVLGLLFGIVGGLLKLIFSKNVIMLAGIGLIVYLIMNRKKERETRDLYY